uniref:Phage integrase n=1 Tax=Hydrogenovibrio crunogenus (strain DSM 25203 / XCL-2) TaxID=317025 RepID=Q31HX1_HYDCU
MSPKAREISLGLPPNLYAKKDKRNGKVYYQYKSPLDGKFYSFGTDKNQAVNDAVALNHNIYDAIQKSRVEKLKKPACILFRDFWQIYFDSMNDRKLKPNTIKTRKSQYEACYPFIGNTPLNEVRVKDVADIINHYIEQDKRRTASAIRSTLKDAFKEAIHQGIVEDNPAEKTRAPSVPVKRQRFNLDQVLKVLEINKETWLENAILLALITGQRVSDIAKMKFKDFDGEYLYVIQKKNRQGAPEKRYKYHKDIKLDALSMTLGDIINKCRDNVISKHLVHHTKNEGLAKKGTSCHEQTISKRFTWLVREVVDGQNLPTFHELRSLSARLYKAQGNISEQKVLGHKSAKSTEIYTDARGSEWVAVEMGITKIH